MKVITAPEEIDLVNDFPRVFLAGGIQKCPPWQKEIIELLELWDGVILNPRRENFPINDAKAGEEQIEWEFHALNNAHVFSIWFCNADSDQPICMYELGRFLALKNHLRTLDTMVIGVEPGYRRELDVFVQVSLINKKLKNYISGNLFDHARNITNAVRQACLYNNREGEKICQ